MVNPGDQVIIKTKEDSFEGTIIARPKLLGENEIILKLKNGYNIGINKSDIKDIKLIKERERKVKDKNKITSSNPDLPNILILSTGGTISSKVDYTTGGVIAEYDANDFIEMCPEIKNIANVHAKKAMSIMSEDIKPKDWIDIANIIKNELKNYDGIILTMGTDTLAYTASALSFMIQSDKPIVITAAQRSIDRGSSDAFFNLISSVNVASNWDGCGVVVCMHGTSSDEYCNVLNPTKLRKMHSSRRDAFRPINCSEIARVYGDKNIEIISNNYSKRKDTTEKFQISFENNVGLIYIYPGIKKEIIKSYKHYRGVILVGTGFGHIPENIYDEIKELIDNDVFVGMTTQCIYGKTSSTVYSPLRRLSIELGITFLEDMLLETAYTKLGWAASLEKDNSKLKEIMLNNLSYEIEKRIDFNNFLN